MLRAVLPSIVVALGILVSAQVVTRTADSGWLILAGPSVMALSMVIAGLLARRLPSAPQTAWYVPPVLAGILMITAVILTAKNPRGLVDIMPILGAGIAFPMLVGSGTKRDHCAPKRSG